MSEPVFRSLRIDAFRGFNEPVTLDLSASAVLLRGPNGTGKTSVFDALQWLLLGDIARLRALRERRDAEHLVNRYRLPGPAVVEAEIETDGTIAVARRSGNYSGSQLSFKRGRESLEGEPALAALTATLLPSGAGDIGAVLLTSGMLQQDVMRSLLEAKPAERFAALSRLLRLEHLESFQKAVERASERATQRTARVRAEAHSARRTRQLLEERGGTLREEAMREETIERATADFAAVVEAVATRIRLATDRPAVAQAASLVAREATRMRRRIGELALELTELESRPALGPPSAEELAAAEQSVADIRRVADDLRKQGVELDERLAALERSAEEFAELASRAIPLLGERCPVCSQRIVRDDVESHLLERARGTSALIELRAKRDELRRVTEETTRRLQAADTYLTQLRQVQQDALRRQQLRSSLVEDLKRAGKGQALRLLVAPTDPNARRVVEDDLLSLEDAAERLTIALGASAAATQLAAVESELELAKEIEEDRSKALERTARAEADASTLVRATKGARVEVAENRYARVRPLVRDLFARLDAHRAFTELDLEPTLYGRAGTTVMATTRDPERDLTASPALVYSSAQANVAALAYFVALSWGAQDHALPFLMLDDPLQSMDDVNILAFADLCRFLRTRRQLFLSTHERRFGDLLERKLAPRHDDQRTVVLDFSGWDRGGPDVLQRVLPRARTDIADAFLRHRRSDEPVSR